MRRIDALSYLPGDLIELNVPAGRCLPEGIYEASVFAAVRRRDVNFITVLKVVMPASRPRYLTVYIPASEKINEWADPYGERCLFLDFDTDPVSYRHTENLEARLLASIARASK